MKIIIIRTEFSKKYEERKLCKTLKHHIMAVCIFNYKMVKNIPVWGDLQLI